LLTAFQLVSRNDGRVRLGLTGDPPPDVLRQVATHPAAGRIDLYGRVPDSELARLYRRASVVAYPSILEGFGFPVLEAFASDTPVVAAASGSIPEIAGGGARLVGAGRPQELGEAIIEVLSDEQVAQDLRVRGRARAREFCWSKTAQLTLDLYRAVA
jgi:glycosyltransferase involved in cell wall biosynthesis